MTAERTKQSFDTVSVRNFVAKVAISPDRWLDRTIAVVLNVPTPEDQAIANTPPAAALLMVKPATSNSDLLAAGKFSEEGSVHLVVADN